MKLKIILCLCLLLLAVGCKRIVTINSGCVGQEEYEKLTLVSPKSVEERIELRSDCSEFCSAKNMSCYSYEVKGCNILADDTIYKCLTPEKEMKIFLIKV